MGRPGEEREVVAEHREEHRQRQVGVVEAALDALREEYEDLEADDCVEAVAGQPAVGHDVRFFSLDLTNTCWTRSFYSSRGTVLVLCQANDLELDKHEPVLRAHLLLIRIPSFGATLASLVRRRSSFARSSSSFFRVRSSFLRWASSRFCSFSNSRSTRF